MSDHRPIAAYVVTLVVDGVRLRILTTGRDEQHLRTRFAAAAMRRSKTSYEPADRSMDEVIVDWGNVQSWELTDVVRGGTWER